jgi:DNA replication and repair protein RecF
MTETMVSRAPLDQPPSPEVATGVSWLRRIMVSHFRNYHAAEIICDSRPLVLTGPNGAGKTNLLEAVSLLAPGRGLRGAKMGDLDRHEPATGTSGNGLAGSWAVAAEVVTPEGQYDLGTGRPPPPDGGGSSDRRIVKVDGVVVRGQQRLGEILGIVWVTPQMDGLFREAPSGRRRFLDRLVFGFDPAHAGRVNAYDHARRERARLLKSNHKDDAWLLAVEDNMARHGVAIAAARQSATTRLAAAAATGVGRFPAAGLALACRLQDWLQEMPALAAEEAFKRALADARATDALSGTTALGPHRSDLAVTHLERNMDAELCSTGEQKALLVSIILAHARLLRLDRGGAPLLLLDEVAAHLDADRRRALYEEILALSAQAWLTGTDPDVFAELGDAAQFFEVSHARVTAGNVSRGS